MLLVTKYLGRIARYVLYPAPLGEFLVLRLEVCDFVLDANLLEQMRQAVYNRLLACMDDRNESIYLLASTISLLNFSI